MSFNTFGHAFRFTTYGESHGTGIGVIIDGCPARIELDMAGIQDELVRRKPGQSEVTTERKEDDIFQVTSGIFEGKTTGAPIHIFIPNKNARPKDYNHLKQVNRPSHADYVYQQKYGIRDHRGGGRSSARETACRVVVGAIAKQILNTKGIHILGYTSQIGDIKMPKPHGTFELRDVESSIVRCPDAKCSADMINTIDSAKSDQDSIGGVVTCVTTGLPIGLGEELYHKINAQLASAILSINACRGIEFGLGFESAVKRGSEQNDLFDIKDGSVQCKTNFSGGIQAGLTNGMPVTFSAVFKAPSSIGKAQTALTDDGKIISLKIEGRHDPCIVPRAVPVVEAMTACVILDFYLRRFGYHHI